MDQPNSLQPPPLPETMPKRNRRWPKIMIGTIAGGFLAIGLLGSLNSPSLEVRRLGAIMADDAKALEILNVGTKPVTITKMAINDRADCQISRFTWSNNSSLPAELKVGDKALFLSSCPVIRAAIETDQGSNTYSFRGD